MIFTKTPSFRCLLLAAILVATSSVREATAAPPESPAGVHFDDADITKAINMFEGGGEPDGATKLLESVIKDPNSPNLKERDGELKAALGMLYARAGDKQKAQAVLRPLAERKEDTTLPDRAKVLLAAATGAYKDGTKGSANLGPRQGWLDAIKGVRRDLELKLQQQDANLTSAVNAQQYDRVAMLLPQAEDLADQIRVIEVDPEASKKMLATHADALKADSAHIHGDIEKAKRERAELNSELKDVSVGKKNKNRDPAEQERLKLEIKRKDELIETMIETKRMIDEARANGGAGADDQPGKRGRGGRRGGRQS